MCVCVYIRRLRSEELDRVGHNTPRRAVCYLDPIQGPNLMDDKGRITGIVMVSIVRMMWKVCDTYVSLAMAVSWVLRSCEIDISLTVSPANFLLAC